MKKRLLSININGIKNIKNETIKFFTEQNVKRESDETFQAFKINKNITLPNIIFFHGKNASGKSNILKAISTIENFSDLNSSIQNFIIKYSFYNTFKSNITTTAFYAVDNFIFKHELDFIIDSMQLDTLAMDGSNLFTVKIFRENISYLSIDQKTLTKDLNEFIDNEKVWNIKSQTLDVSEYYDGNTKTMNFPIFGRAVYDFLLMKEIVENNLDYSKEKFDELKGKEIKEIQKRIEEFGMKIQIGLTKFNNMLIPESKLPRNILNRLINEEEFNIEPFIKIFDKNIEKIKFDLLTNTYTIKYVNNSAFIRINTLDGFVSSGTIRGMCLLALFSEAIKRGEDIFIDEIESNLNHKIIKFFIDIIKDKEINKNNARIIASTHYAYTLDYSKRRDSIFLTFNESSTHSVKRLSEITEIKDFIIRMNDYKNSKLIKKIYSIDLDPEYEDFINFKKELMNE